MCQIQLFGHHVRELFSLGEWIKYFRDSLPFTKGSGSRLEGSAKAEKKHTPNRNQPWATQIINNGFQTADESRKWQTQQKYTDERQRPKNFGEYFYRIVCKQRHCQVKWVMCILHTINHSHMVYTYKFQITPNVTLLSFIHLLQVTGGMYKIYISWFWYISETIRRKIPRRSVASSVVRVRSLWIRCV